MIETRSVDREVSGYLLYCMPPLVSAPATASESWTEQGYSRSLFTNQSDAQAVYDSVVETNKQTMLRDITTVKFWNLDGVVQTVPETVRPVGEYIVYRK